MNRLNQTDLSTFSILTCWATSYGVYISQLIRFARASSRVDDFNERTLFITNKLLKQGYRYHKLRKYFTMFYHRNSDFIERRLSLLILFFIF
jgi:hypothetical protein